MSGKDGESVLGEVITFYSYKGGTARTTALANVACLLAEKQTEGKGVLMIDWDLEAPGLHHFFHDQFSGAAAEQTRIGRPFKEVPGLIDLFLKFEQETPAGSPKSYKDAEERGQHCLKSVQIEDYVVSTGIPHLSLMTAGCFDLKYASRVNKFDWKGLYNRSPLLFQLLATHLTKTEKYRYVLIDSRTGITDVSGICTALMPEKLIAVFTPNQQSLTGVISQLKWANEYRRKSTDLRPLLAFPLLSRIDISEQGLRDAWRLGDQNAGIVGFQPFFEAEFKTVYDLSDCDLTRYFDKIQVLHAPAYSYGEKIAALIEKTEGPGTLRPIYRDLCEELNNGHTPWSEPSQAERVAKLAQIEAQVAISIRLAEIQTEVASKANRFAKWSIAVAACLVLLVGATIWLWLNSYDLNQALLKVKSLIVGIHVSPAMVVIPGGTFQVVDVEDSRKSAKKLLEIKTFALGQSEVTFDEYDRYAISQGKPLPNDQNWGRGQHPVINVSWNEAKAYAQWLSQHTGKRYRLPTEVEWEYAARSGGKDEIWAGTSNLEELKNYAVYGTAGGTELVGSKKPNGFGLNDLSGNVWEWVNDCWQADYTGTSTANVDCKQRVIRGGSYTYDPESLRVSKRNWSFASGQNPDIGFRLAQDLEP